MKRKILCLLLALSMINIGGLSAFASTPVDVYDEYLHLYETFEEDTIEADKTAGELIIGESNNTAQYETPGANGTEGAVRMEYKVDSSYNTFKMKLVPKQKYRVSAWIKLNDISLKNNQLHFLYWSKMVDQGDTNGYTLFMVNDAGLKKNEWVQVSTVITGPEQVRIAGVGNYPVDPNAIGSIGIRFGDNGQFSNIDGDKTYYDFSIDDFIVEPLVEDVTVDSSVTLTFTGSDCNYSKNDDVPAGLTGQSYCVTSKTFGYVNLKYKAPDMWLNRAYKIGYWAKAALATGGTYGSVQAVVYNSTAYSSKDKRIPRWPSYTLTASGGSSALTDEWTYYEFIYYKGLNTFDERLAADGNVELRVNCGATSGSKVYMAGMEIKPLDMPYQETVNYSSINKSAATNVGWYFESSSNIEEDNSVYDTGYRMIETTDSPKQYVQIKNNRRYKISFKAKAESYVDDTDTTFTVGTDVDSVPIFAVLDRTGDKPTPASGTSTEDWTDNYTSVDKPSYEYQYISGAELTKDDAWSAEQANENINWNLTSDWQEFSAVYTWEYLGNDYRMPLLGFCLGEDVTNPVAATWSIADVKIEDITDSVDKVENFYINGDLVEESEIDISYDYISGENEEGISYVRVLTGDDASGWITLDVVKATVFENGYEIPTQWAGKKIKIELLPISVDGDTGVLYSTEIDVRKIFEIKAVDLKWKTNSITGKICFTENRYGVSGEKYIIVIAQYDENNTMLSNYTSIPMSVSYMDDITKPFSVPKENGAVKARVFVWGGTSVFDTDMIAHIDIEDLGE